MSQFNLKYALPINDENMNIKSWNANELQWYMLLEKCKQEQRADRTERRQRQTR